MPLLTGQIARAQQLIDRCRQLSRLSEHPGRVCRTFLSPPMRDCYRQVEAWMTPLGMSVRIDAAGNLRGLYPGSGGTTARLLIGSHLDTVPDAGAFDGILGVLLALALVESLEGERLPFAIEVIGFSEEEGVRFAVPFIGSRALVGSLDDALLNRLDSHGISVRTAIQAFGLDDRQIPQLVLTPDAIGYLEFHIEQGPVLEHANLPLGIVEAIAGQTRMQFTFSGASGHAGTTPMHSRRDALVAAAEWAVAVEAHARETTGLVATVGAMAVTPGASNVIAGHVVASLDVRHASDSRRKHSLNEIVECAEEISQRRGVQLETKILSEQPAVAMDPFFLQQIETAMIRRGITPHRMVSGAGHDAMILAGKVPSAMIFVRSPGGISHNPEETVLAGDVVKAIECGHTLLRQLANSAEFQTRTSCA